MSQKSAHDQEQMQAASQKIEETANDLNKIKNDLSSEHQQLGSTWQGSASNAFTKVYTEFDGQLDKVLQALNQLNESLVQSKINYQASEEAQEQEINGLAGLL